MTHRSSFPPAGGLSLRLALAVAAARRGEIYSVGGVGVSKQLANVSRVLEFVTRSMTDDGKARFDIELGVFCLAVSTQVLPLVGAIDEPGANGARVERSEAADAARSRLHPDGNHGDNNNQGSLLL